MYRIILTETSSHTFHNLLFITLILFLLLLLFYINVCVCAAVRLYSCILIQFGCCYFGCFNQAHCFGIEQTHTEMQAKKKRKRRETTTTKKAARSKKKLVRHISRTKMSRKNSTLYNCRVFFDFNPFLYSSILYFWFKMWKQREIMFKKLWAGKHQSKKKWKEKKNMSAK